MNISEVYLLSLAYHSTFYYFAEEYINDNNINYIKINNSFKYDFIKLECKTCIIMTVKGLKKCVLNREVSALKWVEFNFMKEFKIPAHKIYSHNQPDYELFSKFVCPCKLQHISEISFQLYTPCMYRKDINLSLTRNLPTYDFVLCQC